MRKIALSSVLTVLLTILSVIAITAQSTCSVLVERALSEVDENCGVIDRNEACYGYNMVRAEFQSVMPDDFFTHPADITPIIDLKTIATSPFDEANDTWGVAVMSLQANLPDTLPGQNVTFVLLGDTEVENAVEADEIVTANTVQVITTDFVTVRSGPGDTFNALAGFAQGSNFIADGISQDGEWVRVLLDEGEGWIRISRLRNNPDIALLTPESGITNTPMQAIYLRTGIGQPSCQDAPDDILLIQGPENYEIELTVNGANFRIGSTVSMRLLTENLMEVYVIDGKVEVLDDDHNPTGLVIQTGQRSTACLGEPDDRGLDGEANDRVVECDFSPPEWVPSPELGTDWCMLQNIPSSFLSYPIDIFCPGDMIPTPVPPPTATPLPPPPVIIVPPTAVVDVTTDVTEEVNVPTIDCSGFQLLGPFDGITPRDTTFSWTALAGATDYEIVFYDYTGQVAQTFFTQDTSITLNVGRIPTGSELQFETRAYTNGVYLCVTPRTPVITRLADPNPPPVTVPAFTAVIESCVVSTFDTTVVIVWDNASPNDDVVAYGVGISTFDTDSDRGTGVSGSLTLNIMDYTGINSITVATSSNDNLSLPDCKP